MIRRKHVSFAAFSCTHCPLHSRKAVAWLLKVLADRRPDVVVMLGDLMDADFASVHENDEFDHDALDEYREGSGLLDSIYDVTPDARHVWMLGNHDDNIQRRDARRVPKAYRRAIHWSNSIYRESFARWMQVDYSETPPVCYQLGQVIFCHGFSTSQGLGQADKREAVRFIHYTGGHAHRLYVRGHTHAPYPVTQLQTTGSLPLPMWVANAGTLADIPKLEYMRRRSSLWWGPAVVIGEARMGRGCQPARNWGAYVMRPNGQAADHT